MTHDPKRHEGYDERLVDYVYGELSEQRALEVEQRLERDPDARAEVDSLKAVRAAFSALPDAQPSPKVTYDILREARVAAADRAAQRKSWFGGGLPKLLMHPAFASVCALVLVSGAILALQKTGADRPIAPVAADEELGVFAAKSEATTGRPALAEPAAVAVTGAAKGLDEVESDGKLDAAADPARAPAAVAAAKPAEPEAEEGLLDALLGRSNRRLRAPKPEGSAKRGGELKRKAPPARPAREVARRKAPKAQKEWAPQADARERRVAKPAMAPRAFRGGGKKAGVPRGAVATKAKGKPQKAGKMTAEDMRGFGQRADLGGGGDSPAKDKGAQLGEDDGWAVSQAPSPSPTMPQARPSAAEAIDMDELMAAGSADSASAGSAGNVGSLTTADSAPATRAPQAQGPAQAYGYEVGDGVLGGVRAGARHQDLGSRELNLRIRDLDRLPAGQAWGDSLGAVARSNQRTKLVDRVRRKLLTMDFRARASYARYIREQIRTLQGQGNVKAAAELRELLEHIEFEEAKEPDIDAEQAGAEDDADYGDAAELERMRDDKAAPKSEAYRPADRNKRSSKKAKVKMLRKKSRSAPVPADMMEEQKADEAPVPASAF